QPQPLRGEVAADRPQAYRERVVPDSVAAEGVTEACRGGGGAGIPGEVDDVRVGALQQRRNEMGADESGCARDQHAPSAKPRGGGGGCRWKALDRSGVGFGPLQLAFLGRTLGAGVAAENRGELADRGRFVDGAERQARAKALRDVEEQVNDEKRVASKQEK